MKAMMTEDREDMDEVRIFECDLPDDDQADRLSPVIKDEEVSQRTSSSSFSPSHYPACHPTDRYFPYLISPYYHPTGNADQTTGLSESPYPVGYSPHWHSPIFPFGLPPPNTFSSSSVASKRASTTRQFHEPSSPQSEKHSKSKKSHIKKPLNAFMLFMKEQRAQVVQECTLRESAAINQILGRKWHELDRNVQQKYYDMARHERMKHMQLYPGWSARDNYGVKKKRTIKGTKRDNQSTDTTECLNQKKCRARFGLDQQSHWCKHCKRKKKCLRYTENESRLIDANSWSEDNDDTDQIDDSSSSEISFLPPYPHAMPMLTGFSQDA